MKAVERRTVADRDTGAAGMVLILPEVKTSEAVHRLIAGTLRLDVVPME